MASIPATQHDKTGLAHSEKAMKQSETAHGCCQDAHAKSKTAAH